MTGYVQWAASQEFRVGDVVLNGGLLWRLVAAGQWRIIGIADSEFVRAGGAG